MSSNGQERGTADHVHKPVQKTVSGSLLERFFSSVKGIAAVISVLILLASGIATVLILQIKVDAMSASHAKLVERVDTLSSSLGTLSVQLQRASEMLSDSDRNYLELEASFSSAIESLKDRNISTSGALDEFCTKMQEFAEDIDSISRQLYSIEASYSAVIQTAQSSSIDSVGHFFDAGFLGSLGEKLQSLSLIFDEMDVKYRTSTRMSVCEPMFLRIHIPMPLSRSLTKF